MRNEQADLSREKKRLRQYARQLLSALNDADRSNLSHRICERLIVLPEFVQSRVIMVFLSLMDEVDTTAIIERAWKEQKKVVAPKVDWVDQTMTPVEIRSLATDVAVKQKGVREPIVDRPVPVSEVDLIIVPGLAFDESGHRLGRGGGFYDRFLARPECHGVACAVSFDFQIAESIPVGSDDRPLDILVTQNRVLRFV